MVVPERIPVREVPLKRDFHNDRLERELGPVGAQINKKALEQAEEEFESPAEAPKV